MQDGRVKVFLAMGGNFLSATPDTELTAQALRRCRLTAQVSTKLNRGHLITGEQALILPCLGRTEIDRQASGEQFVTVEDSMGIINPSRGNLAPASEHLLSEVAIVCGLARAVLGPRKSDRVGGALRQLRPHSRPYRARHSRLRVFQRAHRRKGRFTCRTRARDGIFETASGKAVFTAHPLPDNDLPDGQFALDDDAQPRSIQHDHLRSR